MMADRASWQGPFLGGATSSETRKSLNTRLLHFRPYAFDRGGYWLFIDYSLAINGFITNDLWMET